MTRVLSRFAVLVVGLALAGCGIADFDTDVTASGEIPGLLSPTSALPKSMNASTSLAQTFDSKGIDASHVKSLKVTSGRLSVTAGGATNHLGYIQSFDVYVSAKGQSDVRIATIPAEKFANRPTFLEMTLDDVELKPFLVAGDMTLNPKIVLSTSSRPPTPVPLSVSLTLHVSPQL